MHVVLPLCVIIVPRSFGILHALKAVEVFERERVESEKDDRDWEMSLKSMSEPLSLFFVDDDS